MKIADYRHRIKFLKKTYTRDSEGMTVETWQDVATVWASYEPISGREYFAAAAVNAENTARFRIRYYKDISPDMRVLFDGRTFDIKSVIDVQGRRREMELMCQELTNGGN